MGVVHSLSSNPFMNVIVYEWMCSSIFSYLVYVVSFFNFSCIFCRYIHFCRLSPTKMYTCVYNIHHFVLYIQIISYINVYAYGFVSFAVHFARARACVCVFCTWVLISWSMASSNKCLSRSWSFNRVHPVHLLVHCLSIKLVKSEPSNFRPRHIKCTSITQLKQLKIQWVI